MIIIHIIIAMSRNRHNCRDVILQSLWGRLLTKITFNLCLSLAGINWIAAKACVKLICLCWLQKWLEVYVGKRKTWVFKPLMYALLNHY